MYRVLHLLRLAFAVALIASPVHGREKAKQTVQASDTAALKAPDVKLTIIPDRDGTELRQTIDLVVIVTNNSAIELKNVKLSTQSKTFELVSENAKQDSEKDSNDSENGSKKSEQASAAITLADIAALGSGQWTGALTPRTSSEAPAFGVHKAAVTVSYEWKSPAGKSMTSEQTEAVSLSLLRRFDEEGKSLPGGTATFLYLILPLVPAFFAYDFVDRWRKGETFAMPTFGTEQIVPAFLLAFLLSISFVTIRGFSVETAYTDRTAFFEFLAASAGIGALVPVLRGLWAAFLHWRWGFKATDTAAAYLRKALSSPYQLDRPVWIEGTAAGITWKGMQLRQPDGTMVLGARLQVSPGSSSVKLDDVKHALTNSSSILSLIKAEKVNVRALEKIEREAEKLERFIVTEGLAQFEIKNTSSKTLVEATS